MTNTKASERDVGKAALASVNASLSMTARGRFDPFSTLGEWPLFARSGRQVST
jgi:hypothetical protein